MRTVHAPAPASTETTFKNLQTSDALEQLIQNEVAKLDHVFHRIVRIRVVVEKSNRHHRIGATYHARIEIDVPGKTIVIAAQPNARATLAHEQTERFHKDDEFESVHKYAGIAIQDAFRRARRRLQDRARREMGAVKHHDALPIGVVSKLLADYGFLRTPDEREIYFHRNSVPNGGFDRLRLGSSVRFVEEAGERGAQASRVAPIRHHG